MLHLENFFEKSFALLLTTPIKSFERKRGLTSPLFLWYCKKVKKMQ